SQAETVSPAEVAQFQRDGVIALRQKFNPEWVNLLRETIDESRNRPSPHLVRHTKEPNVPAYFEDFWSWSMFDGFEKFVRESPTAAHAMQLLGAERVNLVMDNWFMREAGSKSRPPFHQDLSYFDFFGTMCVLWMPLEPVTVENGISFVRGSHLWGKHFMRVRFADGHKADVNEKVTVNGVTYEPPPDINGNPDDFDLVSFDLDVGDCIYFDMRTLHGGLSDVIPTETVRRYTLRMTKEDGMLRYRGDWAKGEREMFEAAGYKEGDAIAGNFFPQLYPRTGTL
ncbi:MAG: ectoine hydroxylase-related dioxygenase (phytanoyl-CoA dioxygenase family), partial [Candidatus Promineifilaceae bacterium]